MAGRNALGYNRAAGVLSHVNHLGARVGLLPVVHQSHRVEFTDRIVALQNDAGVLPGDGRASLHLCPGDFGIGAGAFAPLGNKVEHTTLAVLVAGVPVLQGAVFDFSAFHGHQFNYRSVQLVGFAHRRGAAFEVTDVGALVSHNQRPLKLAAIGLVDTEVGHQLDGATHAWRYVGEGTVGENGRVERRVEIVGIRHHRTQVFLHQIRMFLHGFAHGAENYSGLLQLLLIGGRNRYTIQHRIDSYAGQPRLLFQRYAQLAERLQHLRVNIFYALGPFFRRLGRGVVTDVLKIDGRVLNVSPGRLAVVLASPEPIRLESPFQHPLRLILLGRDQPHDILAEALGKRVLLDVDGETPFVIGVQLRGSSIPGNYTLALCRHRTGILLTAFSGVPAACLAYFRPLRSTIIVHGPTPTVNGI